MLSCQICFVFVLFKLCLTLPFLSYLKGVWSLSNILKMMGVIALLFLYYHLKFNAVLPFCLNVNIYLYASIYSFPVLLECISCILNLHLFPIQFCRLDKTKFYVVGAGLFTGLTVALYPVSVVKTRLQVASKDVAEKNAFSVIRGILRTDGIPGLYRGFGTVITGAIPARILFLTALETTKVASYKLVEPLEISETTRAAIANGIAGMTAALFSQAVFVPIDVVCRH